MRVLRSGDELSYAGFWPRLAAHLLDLAVLAPYLPVALWLSRESPRGFVASQVIGTVIAIVFEIYMVTRFGGSPGKLIMKLRVAKLDGGRVGYGQALLRYSVLGVTRFCRLLRFPRVRFICPTPISPPSHQRPGGSI